MVKKLVNVHCDKAFSINGVRFTGTCNLVVLRDEDIAICLEFKAKVEEVLAGGVTVPLGFDNYNTYNGPSKLPNIQTAKAITEEYSEPIVETVTDRKPVEATKKPEVKVEEVKEEKSSLEQADVNGSVKVENSEASPKKENKQYKK
jgi:hypothetical protein